MLSRRDEVVPDRHLAPTLQRRPPRGWAWSWSVALSLLVLTLAAGSASSQPYAIDEFRARDGLPNNLVKHVLQDDVGFVWIATDGGLVRFDGVHLTTYTAADGLPSSYVKSLFLDSRGRLYAITDAGIAQVDHEPPAVRFSLFAAGRTSFDEAFLFYPKEMYEDQRHNLWVADARGVVRISSEGLVRYDLPEHSWPDSFVRAYALLEDDLGHLIAVSERGSVFILHDGEDRFVELETEGGLAQCNAAILLNDGRIWAGGAYGLYSFRVTEDHQVSDWQVVSDLPNIMVLRQVSDESVIVGTSGEGITVLSKNGDTITRPYPSLSTRVIQDIAEAKEGVLIAGTDNGFVLIRRSFFSPATDFRSTAIQSLATDPRGEVYGIESFSFFRINRDGPAPTRETLFTASHGLTTLATDGRRHWAGGMDGTVYLFRSGTLTSFVLRHDQAVASIALDRNGNAWISQYRSPDVARITPDGTIRYYGSSDGIMSTSNVVRYLEGQIYAGGEGDHHLFKYVPASDRFADISQPISFRTSASLTVYDVDITPDGNLWLATNEGLLTYGSGSLTRITGDERLASQEIRALTHDRFGHTWIGTGRGVFRYTAGEIAGFGRDPGIENATVSYRSMVTDADQRVWVGQHSGISYWNGTPGETLVTPRPVVLRVKVDSSFVEERHGRLRVKFGSIVEAEFVSLSLPGDGVRYQMRWGDGDGGWRPMSPARHVQFPYSDPGEYVVEVRAQQDGHEWSAPARYEVVMAVPWFRTSWAVALFVVVGLALVILVLQVHDTVRTRQLRTRSARLERLVTKRTKELNDRNLTIEQTNSELKRVLERNHEFLGIAAHDLRNPLTSLIGFSELLLDGVADMTPEEFSVKAGEVLPIIHRAGTTMQGVIQDLLDSQLVERAERKLRLEESDLGRLARTVVNMNEVASRRKGITLTFHPRGSFRTIVDERSMQRVLDNLISNAIKYSPPGSEVDIRLHHTGKSIRFSVIDRGPGLTEDDKSKVFGKLQRLSARPTAGEPSTGLGLYIARAITEMHEGRIGVNSILGQGSEFWVEIPALAARAAA